VRGSRRGSTSRRSALERLRSAACSRRSATPMQKRRSSAPGRSVSVSSTPHRFTVLDWPSVAWAIFCAGKSGIHSRFRPRSDACCARPLPLRKTITTREVCHAKRIGIILGGIYNSGILANPRAGAKFNYEDADAALLARALALEALCRKHGTELKAAAVQFCMAHPAVTVALQGARTAAEVSDNIALAERLVPSAFWQELRERKLVDVSAPLPGGA
jgi:hypothetical protein